MVREAAWEPVGRIGEIEVRQYAPMLLARVKGGRESGSFNLLFEYINGNNVPERKIPMTTPVITDSHAGEVMEMTAPVLSDEESMAFVLPQGYDLGNSPQPSDPRVELKMVPERRLAIIRYKGNNPDSKVREMTRRMMSLLNEKGIEIVGKPFLMRYNMPLTPGFLKRNEIAVEIKF